MGRCLGTRLLPVEGVCRYSGIDFVEARRFPLTRSFEDCYRCKFVKPTTLGWALERRLKNIRYRRSVHRTHPKFRLPSFDTRMLSSLADQSGDVGMQNLPARGLATVFPYTLTPSHRTPAYCEVNHGTTVFEYTGKGRFTAFSYTATIANYAELIRSLGANCTKLSFKLYNWGVDVFFTGKRGES